ncbi:uncharacterized protein LOC128030720 isoform X1 [Carassius gibelio]|uniref:uncharacterized protein LOC128030720 isoform X1 n=1 Tax=Carassius gibelio TaxID=101364 RepID=UPI0022793E50|nr:uncharacterized protein LOC128030720 isoform X1 [Carassius gibelio]
MIMRTSLLLALFFCFSLVEGTSLKGKTCVGVRRGDTSYDFALPDAVAVKVQDLSCDAEWSIDQFTAILEGNVAHFKHPFKKVNRTGISVAYCPFSVKFHVSCHDYAKHLTCSCTNSTSIYPVFSTTRPYGDLSSTAVETHSSVRQHFQKFHTKQKNNSSNKYPHFAVGRGYGTADCINNASSLSLVLLNLLKITSLKFLFWKPLLKNEFSA